ncbi:MAG: DUF1553 domain-containing protein [Verrucomicrobia bacterium]|nr:DUF1553 domain-containing protein [Verrucomicrobiota bacterium]
MTRPILAGLLWCAAGLGWLWTGSSLAASAPVSGPAAEAMRLLRDECASCHNSSKRKGGLDLTSAEGLKKGSENGPVVKRKSPESSMLLKVLAPSGDPHMPPKKQLGSAEIRTLRAWLQQGAPWDREAFLAEPPPKSVVLLPNPDSYRPVHALAVSPDGRQLAVARGRDLFLAQVDTSVVTLKTRVIRLEETLESLAWVEEGKRIAAGGFRRVLWINPASPGSGISSTLTHSLSGRILAMKWHAPSGSLLIADEGARREGFVRVVEGSEPRVARSWKAHADSVFALDLSADGKWLATAGGDKVARVWEFDSGKEIAVLEGHTAQVLGVAFNTNATQLATGGADKALKIYDLRTREKAVTPGNHRAGLSGLRWPHAHSMLFASSEDGGVYRYTDLKVHSGEQSSATGNEKKIGDLEDPVSSLEASPDGSRVFAGTQAGTVRIWDKEGKLLGKLEPKDFEAAARVDASPPPKTEPDHGPEHRVAKTASKRRGTAESVEEPLSFVRDVLPVLNRAGCNAGSCHAKPEGQNGFKLSVFSYDPKADHHEIVKESRGRRVFPAAPLESLLLLKPTGRLPHEGGVRIEPGSREESVLVRWIRQGMPYRSQGEAELTGIEAAPAQGRYRRGSTWSLRVSARYSDGTTRDVTSLAAFDSNDKEIAKVDERGRVKIGKLTGQAVVLARFMGHVADSQVTVPAEKILPVSRYAALPRNNLIDDLAYAHFQKLGLFPSPQTTDAAFLRRAKLDAIGVLPTAEEARAFIADPSPDKRARLVDQLLDSPHYADYWANKWADLVRPNPDRVGLKSVFTLDQWLRDAFRNNVPFDRFARSVLTAEGSNHREGPAVIYRDRREPPELTTMFSQLFLGVRLECAKCHHHPNEKWSQDDFYQLAAFFGEVRQKGAGLSPPISAGTESFFHAPGGSVKHPVTGEVMKPVPLGGGGITLREKQDPRAALADWVTAKGNPFFARAAVNRVWAVFFGRGLVDPVDDFRISNPCSNPALLDALAKDFEEHGWDYKHLMRRIMNARLYQLSSTPNETNLADTKNFARAYRRRLPAEVLLDAVSDITGLPESMMAMPLGARAVQAWSYKIESHFMDAYGRPNASSDCPCERERDLSVVQALHMMNSEGIQAKLAHPEGRVARLVSEKQDPADLVTELYLATVTRFPTEAEKGVALQAFSQEGATRQTAAEDILWSLLNSPEFVFNH